jgi:uncharacterized protein (DUF2336 family)
MPGLLSNADVARLLSDPSAEARTDLARRLGGQVSEETLSQGELAIAQDIVRILARDVETTVRATLAHNLRHARDLPRDVALRMAEDVEAVALPILGESLVLTDADLIALVRGGSPDKQTSIAARANLSETVSDSLIDHAHELAVATLMSNPTAQVSDAGMDKAVTRFADSDIVKESMVMRDSLPMPVAERLAVLVSRRLQNHLVQNHALSSTMATDIVMRGREDAIIRLSAGADEPNLLRMVQQMRNTKRLTPSIILRALCTGDIAFFAASLAALADIPVENAHILVHDPGQDGLTRLYLKAGLPEALLPVVRAAVATVEQTHLDGEPHDLERFRTRVITRVLTQDALLTDQADSEYLIDKLGDYLVAA